MSDYSDIQAMRGRFLYNVCRVPRGMEYLSFFFFPFWLIAVYQSQHKASIGSEDLAFMGSVKYMLGTPYARSGFNTQLAKAGEFKLSHAKVAQIQEENGIVLDA